MLKRPKHAPGAVKAARGGDRRQSGLIRPRGSAALQAGTEEAAEKGAGPL